MSKEKLSKEEKKAAKAEKKAAKKENGGTTPDITSAIIQGVAAVLCVAIVAWGASSITDKVTANKLEIAGGGAGSSESGEAGTDDAFGDDFGGDEFAADDTAGDVSGDDAAADVSGDDSGSAASDSGSSSGSSSSGSSSSGSSSDSKSGSGSSSKKALTDAEKLAIYNNATKKAADKKVAFSKSRTTTEKKYEAGLALSSFKSIVYKFMGVGDANKFSKSVTSADADSYFKYFLASSLSASDINKISCKDNGSSYTIQIALKDGATTVSGGKVTLNNKTALDKSGIACGENDKDYWDHKTAQNIYSAISEVPGCGSATIKEKYSNAVVTMDVTKDGNIKSMTAKFFFHIDIDGVMGSSGVAEAESVVTMNNFKY